MGDYYEHHLRERSAYFRALLLRLAQLAGVGISFAEAWQVDIGWLNKGAKQMRRNELILITHTIVALTLQVRPHTLVKNKSIFLSVSIIACMTITSPPEFQKEKKSSWVCVFLAAPPEY